jgi:LmbE family N-acetylglucosaminyl deacetylase
MPPNTHAFLATLSIVMMTSPVTSAAQAWPRTIVALLAHADDESAAAPVLARYAREGVQVYFIVATDGAGGSGSSGYLKRSESGPTGDALAAARVEEARCSAAALGVQPPILLGYPDGKLGDYLGDRSLVYRLTDAIAREIARLRPDVVITWGPDGGTGHPDHRMMSNIATQLQRAGVSGMPERLFYMYLPIEAFRQLSPERGEPPMLFPQAKYFTVHVPFTPQDLEAAQKAMACHRSQFTPELLQRLLPEHGRVWQGKVAFVPAFMSTSDDDLFR